MLHKQFKWSLLRPHLNNPRRWRIRFRAFLESLSTFVYEKTIKWLFPFFFIRCLAEFFSVFHCCSNCLLHFITNILLNDEKLWTFCRKPTSLASLHLGVLAYNHFFVVREAKQFNGWWLGFFDAKFNTMAKLCLPSRNNVIFSDNAPLTQNVGDLQTTRAPFHETNVYFRRIVTRVSFGEGIHQTFILLQNPNLLAHGHLLTEVRQSSVLDIVLMNAIKCFTSRNCFL